MSEVPKGYCCSDCGTQEPELHNPACDRLKEALRKLSDAEKQAEYNGSAARSCAVRLHEAAERADANHARALQAESRLLSLQTAVRNYLNSTELDENAPPWYLLCGALANSGFVVERQSLNSSGSITDGFGGKWLKCGRADCGLHVARPGKAQCHADGCASRWVQTSDDGSGLQI